MVKREHEVIDLTADDHDGEPAAQRRRVHGEPAEPDHLRCPITHEMFRDPVVLQSGHTYERAAIEQHLRNDRTDPLTRARIGAAPVTNMGMRKAVQAWLDDNPGVTPDGWTSREMPPPQPAATNSSLSPADPPIDSTMQMDYFNLSQFIYNMVGVARPREYHGPDLEVLREWRESCPELRDLWRGDDAGHWEGVTWSDGPDGRVTRLSLMNKRLSGQLPRLEGLTSLELVSFGNNQLSGPIPEKLFEGLTSLRGVDLRYNQLSGPIPEKIFEGLTSLRKVYLSLNRLSGPIPEKLFEGLTSLREAEIYRNQLSGPIPEKLFEGLTSLRGVDLHHNQLSGLIPEKLFEGLTSLQKVSLFCNQLTGPIPEKLFEGLTSLREMGISYNQLSGAIPEKLFEGLTSLEYVSLRNNQLSGAIPAKLFEGLISLQTVDLSCNQLSGPISETLFEGLTSLQRVNLSCNQLSGPIPERLREVGVNL